jgi:predicted RecA/RadA family phage recombinase
MAQVPAIRWAQGDNIDYTPAVAVTAGDVVVLGATPLVATQDIAAAGLGSLAVAGVFKVPKVTGAIAAGDPIYWNPAGSPNTGTASSGACGASTPGGYYMGVATLAALSADDYAYVRLAGSVRTRGNNQTVAATGTNQATAAQLGEGFNFVTAADGTKGVLLPVGVAGMTVEVKNDDVANAVLKVYPAGAAQINALGASAAISMALKTSVVFKCYSPTQWYTIPLVPS